MFIEFLSQKLYTKDIKPVSSPDSEDALSKS